jgi:hypothetical protein
MPHNLHYDKRGEGFGKSPRGPVSGNTGGAVYRAVSRSSRRGAILDRRRDCLTAAPTKSAALGELARAHMEPDLAAMVLASLGLTVADLKAAGADAYDLEPLKPEASEPPAEPSKNPNRVVVEERHTPAATLRLVCRRPIVAYGQCS